MAKKEKFDPDAPLVIDKDYYIENGNYVFTAFYLEKRGYCCKNKCRHCPYTDWSKSS